MNIEFTRIRNDVNGNPRYVFHFLALLTEKEREEPRCMPIYEVAIKRAREFGGKRFHNRQYGGGIVVQSFALDETRAAIAKAIKRAELREAGFHDHA